MSNTLSIGGVPLDLNPDTAILPSFQVSDLLKPESIQSDFSPEFSVPGTVRNHDQLGNAAYDGSTTRVPYRSLSGVTLRSEGVDIMPRARLFVKGHENGQYQLQLFAGNRRFVEALGDKTLRDLDFSRFNHLWTLANVTAKATEAHYADNGWYYELFDRGKPLDLQNVSPYDLWPTLSARLVWQQMLAEAGFEASDWQSPLLDKLVLPSATAATLSEDFRDARRLRVGLGPSHEQTGNAFQNRADVRFPIPFDDDTRPIGNVPPIVPTVAGVYDRSAYSYTADETVYVSALARCVVFLEVPFGEASAQVFFLLNGVKLAGGERMRVDKDTRFSVSAQLTRYLLKAGDVLTAEVELRGYDGLASKKWGYTVFRDAVFRENGVVLPVDKFEVQVLEELPPGGLVRLQDWLPDTRQLDFFKTLVQLGGLTVSTDPYEQYLYLSPSRTICDNVAQARDWTAKRDQPDLPAGQARKVVYQYGSFGQRNFFKWAEDDTVTEGYGNGVLVIDDTNLPAEYDMVKLPFAATEASEQPGGLLRIAAYKVRENEDPFADVEYDRVTAKPRLALYAGRSVLVRLVEDGNFLSLGVPVSYFDSPDEVVSLNADTYVLPVNWRGLRAMLTECRYHTERYRLTPRDLADFLADPVRPIWDATLRGYFSVSKISEYTSRRSVEVEMLRLHPSALVAPTGVVLVGEFFEGEFNVAGGEWY